MWFDIASYTADAPWEMAENRSLNLEKMRTNLDKCNLITGSGEVKYING